MTKEVRWRQRFQNFEKALFQLKEGVEAEALSDLAKEGLIQRFEYTFELAWKTLKDYLESQGETVQFARDAIKKGFLTGIITAGDVWMDMLEKRNLMAHTYNEENFQYALNQIHEHYFNAIWQLYQYLKNQL